MTMSNCGNMREKVWPIRSVGSMYRPWIAEKRTRAGICRRQTCRAYAEPISMERAILPFIAKEIAFYSPFN